MKNKTWLVTTVVSLLFSFKSLAYDWSYQSIRYQSQSCPSESQTTGVDGGDFTPFPWGNEIPIAQNMLQGVWAPISIECGTYFSFELSEPTSKRPQRIVTVKQFDPDTCNILASGVGYELEKVFYVSMVGPNGRAFDLTIRAFNRKELKKTDDPYSQDSQTFDVKHPLILLTLYPRK